MAGQTRKTPTTRNKRTGTGTKTTARGQGKMTARGGTSRLQGQGLNAGNTNIAPQMIGTFQQWVRFGQKYQLFTKLYGSTTHQNELAKYQQNKPAGITAGQSRSNQQRLSA